VDGSNPPERHWVRRAGTLVRRLPDGVMVLGPGATPSEPLAVRGPAAAVWDLLERPATVVTITEHLAGLSGAAPDPVRADVRSVVDALGAAGAITEASDHADPTNPSGRPGSGSRPPGWRIRNQNGDLLARLVAGAEPLVERPLAPEHWASLLDQASRAQLVGLLADAIDIGTWAAGEHQRDQAYAEHRRAMAHALALDRELLGLSRRFAEHGIDHRLLKGAAVALLDHDDPSLRPYRDIDLLVGAADIEQARDLLLGEGGERRFPEPRPGYDRRFGKGVCVRLPSGNEIDLHRTLALGPFGLRIDLASLWAGREPVVIGDRAVPALDRPRRFLHAAYHAVLGGGAAPLSLRDVVLTAPRTAEETATVLELARRWSGELLLARAMALVGTDLGLEPPDFLRDLTHPTVSSFRREQAWLDASYGENRSSAKLALAAVGALPWKDRPAYLSTIAFPRQARRPMRLRWRRGMRALASRREP
jgi:hypothetical protein